MSATTTSQASTKGQPVPDTQPRQDDATDFLVVLSELGRGATSRELSETMRTIVSRVMDTGKTGTLMLTIKVEPMKGAERQYVISDQIKAKIPEHDRPASLFFSDSDGNLLREDPDQPALFEELRQAAAPKVIVRTINASTGEVISEHPESENQK